MFTRLYEISLSEQRGTLAFEFCFSLCNGRTNWDFRLPLPASSQPCSQYSNVCLSPSHGPYYVFITHSVNIYPDANLRSTYLHCRSPVEYSGNLALSTQRRCRQGRAADIAGDNNSTIDEGIIRRCRRCHICCLPAWLFPSHRSYEFSV